MSTRRGWIVFAAFALVVIAIGSWIASRDADTSGPSTFSRRASGWRVARAYLEARGAEIHLLDRPFEPKDIRGTLVLAFPWLRRELTFDADVYARWVRRGGTLLVGYGSRVPDVTETEVLTALDAALVRHRGREAGSHAEWKLWSEEIWRLEADETLTGMPAKPVLLRSLTETAMPDPELRVLFRMQDDKGRPRPVIWAQSLGKGKVVFLPFEVFSNGWLQEEGNADLLETLHAWLGPVFTFDEYHHGLSAASAPLDAAAARVFDATLLQLLLLYGLAAWAAVRRMGRAWREPAVRAGSVAPFLVGLGRLHHRLGHHADAARLLLARWRDLDPTLADPAQGREWTERADGADEKELVALAVDVLRQRDRRRTWT